MKNSRVVKSTIGLGSILVLSLGLGSSAFAALPTTFWDQREQIRAENAAKKVAAAQTHQHTDAATPAMACASCKTKVFEDAGLPNVVDKTKPRMVKVGVRHYCDACKGTITRVSGSVNDEMQRNHAACATAACCTAS